MTPESQTQAMLEAPPTHPALPAPSRDGNGDAHGGHADRQHPANRQAPAHEGEHGGEENAIPENLPKPSNTTIIVALCVFVALLLALFLVGWFPHKHQENEAKNDAAEVFSGAPIADVIHAKPESASSDVVLPGDVKPIEDTYLYTRANGYLEKNNYDIGDHVDAGKTMAVIATPDVDAQLAQSLAALAQSKTNVGKSQADLDLANATYQRYVKAQQEHPGSVTEEDVDTKKSAYDDAVSALAAAKSAVDQANANVNQLKVTRSFENIIAPFSGTVVSRNYDPGALLSPTDTTPGKEVFHLARTDVVRVFVNVPQTYATHIKVGDPVFLSVRNYPGLEFEGIIARTAGAIDPVTRTLSVETHFDNSNPTTPDEVFGKLGAMIREKKFHHLDDLLPPWKKIAPGSGPVFIAKGKLYAGMYGAVRLPVPADHPVLIIPSSALVFNAKGSQVAVARDNKVHFQKIEVGRDLGTELEVASGLSSTDDVITNPGERLVEGIEVKTVHQKDSAAK